MAQSGNQNTVIGAIGAVLGYIGAEAATTAVFEQLLWPQRMYFGLTWRNAIYIALLGPAGGPLYKTCLEVLDNASSFGLLRGRGLGHMLGTAFYPQMTSTYTMHSKNHSPFLPHTESARNCMWERVVRLLPPRPAVLERSDEETASKTAQRVRAQVAVCHITLSLRDSAMGINPILDVAAESKSPPLRALTGIVASEITAVLLAGVVAVIWHSWLALLWLGPLALKAISILAALEREPLSLPAVTAEECLHDKPQDFEVHIPAECGTLLLITGPPQLVLQFFRHYGHPKRSRWRELLQLVIVVALAGVFPIGLLVSVTVMPVPIQYAWLSYQMYVVFAMYVSRYVPVHHFASAEQLIAKRLSDDATPCWIWGDMQTRTGVKGELKRTVHGRYGEARAYMDHLIASHP